MLYIIRVGDVIGSWRGEQAVKLQPSAARQGQVQGGGCTEQEPGSPLIQAQDRGELGVEADNPNTVR